jgi:hypothetical protein
VETYLLAMEKTRVQFSLGALRGRAVAAHKAHNLEVDGSIPSPATFQDVGKSGIPRGPEPRDRRFKSDRSD